VTWIKFHTEDSYLWSDLWTSLSSGSFCSVRVNWYTLFFLVGKPAVVMLKYWETPQEKKISRSPKQVLGICAPHFKLIILISISKKLSSFGVCIPWKCDFIMYLRACNVWRIICENSS
jgi:preprotein translocase subunit Sec61beta